MPADPAASQREAAPADGGNPPQRGAPPVRPAPPASNGRPAPGTPRAEQSRDDERKVQPAKANEGKGSCEVCEDAYTIIEAIGGGTYGDVFKARPKEAGPGAALVALKMLKLDEKTEGEGMPITAIREIHILRQLDHENVVKLMEVVVSNPRGLEPGRIYMVFEYMEHDLTGMLENMSSRLKPAEVKCILKQLLHGLHYCHSHNVLHRDLKPANLLLSRDGVLKLADYGLARILSSNSLRNYTNKVVTLWYRAPELLLGAARYNGEIDVWSVGCIFAEILSASEQDPAQLGQIKQYKIGKPIFPGEKEEEQLNFIFYVQGYPTESTWPGVAQLPHYSKLKQQNKPKCGLVEWLKKLGYVTQDELVPAARPTVELNELDPRFPEMIICFAASRRVVRAGLAVFSNEFRDRQSFVLFPRASETVIYSVPKARL